MRSLRLVSHFIQVSIQEEAAYRSNFWISLLYSLLNLTTGILGLVVLFGQVQSIRGWNLASTLALLGVYLSVSALRGLFISPGLDSLSGMNGEIWSGTFDFTVLRPVNTQFLVSVRKWRLFALFDLLLGLGVLGIGISRMQLTLTIWQILVFCLTLLSGVLILYAILLVFTALIFWSPAVMFSWVFDGIFQLARYPLGMYPEWLRLVLTWIIPVGVITTIPVQALSGTLNRVGMIASPLIAILLTVGASVLFRAGLRRYASASG
jgi:ABC-2 type transport system permease protein